MLIRIGLLNYVAGALLMPYAPFLDAARDVAARHGGAGGAVRRVVRAGLPPAVHAAAAGRARRAVLLPARRSGRQRLEAVLRRGLSVRALWRLLPALGGAHRVRPAGRACRCRSRNCPTARPFSASPAPSRARPRTGASRGRCMSSPWAAARACRTTVAYADGLDLERAKVGIGLSCRLCDRPDCRSRAFPPLEHRLALDPHDRGRRAVPVRAEATVIGGCRSHLGGRSVDGYSVSLPDRFLRWLSFRLRRSTVRRAPRWPVRGCVPGRRWQPSFTHAI